MINAGDLRDEVIRPTLEALAAFDSRLNSKAAVDLLMGTAATESLLGYYLVQVGGPALGIFGMESPTYWDIWRYLNRPVNKELRSIVRSFAKTHEPEELVYNLRYAASLTRVKYWMVPAPMPTRRTGQAAYYKKHYNTIHGKGSEEKYLADYQKYVVKELF